MSAPSFSSFPPTFESFPNFDEEEKEGSSSTHKTEINIQPKRHSESKDLVSERKRRKREHKADEKKKHEHTSHKAGIPGLYIIDTAGDSMNEVYGRPHAGDIPKYRRMNYGRVLGLPSHLKIIPQNIGGGLIQMGISGKRPGVRYIESLGISRRINLKTRLLLPSSTTHEVDRLSDFIPLSSIRTSSIDPMPSHRAIEEIKSGSDDDEMLQSDEESSTDADEDDVPPRSAHQQLLTSLETTLREDPCSITSWLALIEYSLNDMPLSSKASLNRARAEIKLSIIERALGAHPKNRESIKLRISWLDAGSEIWDIQKLETEWGTAVHELGGQNISFPLRNAIWNEWLRWRISSAGRRNYGRTNVDEILNDARTVLNNVEGELAKVKTFWRIAVILKEAGYPERAMGLFQAQIELVFNCPRTLISQTFSDRLGNLEEFWDSEQPRIGEQNAKGWDSWDKKSATHAVARSQVQAQTLAGPSSSSDTYSSWANDELRLDATSAMPKRTMDEDGDNPYGTILFADVQPLLMDISNTKSKHLLRMAWLDFIGLHIPGLAMLFEDNSPSYDDVWAYSHLRQRPYLDLLFPTVKDKERQWDAIAGAIVAREKRYSSVFSCVKEWLWGVFDPMETLNGRLILWDKWDMNISNTDLASRIFEQLRRKLGDPICDEEWETIHLSFEAVNNSIKSAAKLSRTLLSTARDALQLWAAHAQLERLRGKEEEARRIYETVLSSSFNHFGKAKLWWTWAEMEWLANRDEAAQVVILRSVGILSGGSTNILRAKRMLEERTVSQEDWKDREAWICLIALLDIILSPHGLEDAMRRLRRYIEDNSLEGVQRESAWAKMLLFAWKHSVLLKRQFQRNRLREFFEEGVVDIERRGLMNSVILGVFLESEKGESVWGRVRALTGESGLSGRNPNGKRVDVNVKGLGRRVWEVWLAGWEQTDWQVEKERIRNSLAIAVADPRQVEHILGATIIDHRTRTRASPILWRIYAEFEIRCKEFEKAKKVLFMAVSECPLVKELYLLAFTSLRRVFKVTELEVWAETMIERGIRFHHGLEEYTGEIKGESSSSDEEEGDDILEKDAKDYRRLAPF